MLTLKISDLSYMLHPLLFCERVLSSRVGYSCQLLLLAVVGTLTSDWEWFGELLGESQDSFITTPYTVCYGVCVPCLNFIIVQHSQVLYLENGNKGKMISQLIDVISQLSDDIN